MEKLLQEANMLPSVLLRTVTIRGNDRSTVTGRGNLHSPYFRSWSSRYRYSKVKLSCFRRVQLSKSKNQY